VQETDPGGSTTLLTSLEIDTQLFRTDASGSAALLTDALGSTIGLADATGAVTTSYTYEPFGATTAAGASSLNRAQYTGRENDGTGLYYYRARYYHAGLQRFISEDPIGFEGGDPNLYAYVANSPIQWSDPLGLILTKVAVPTRTGKGFACVDTGIAPDLARAVAQAQSEGLPLLVTEGFRSRRQQEEYYKQWQQNPSAFPKVGLPGTSYHEAGLAVDVSVATLGQHYGRWREIARANGLYDDVTGDQPHFQVRHITEYGYTNLAEAISHNKQQQCPSSKSSQ
jgi:RHS repeat-associated protein